MSFRAMVDFLDSTYCLKDQLVPCLVGPVGIGKTAAVRQHAENVGANKVVEIIASQILPNEVSGITMPDSETKAMEIYDHFRLSSLEDGDILFFDELLEADQMVLSACLTLIESRTMMSGRKLPDIQIIAATNPTIQPNMLKENIRQRFIFRRFTINKVETGDYIEKECGFRPSREVLDNLVESGDEYNILSPRSLTKMCNWIAATPEDKLNKVADQIDEIWHSRLGSELMNSYRRKTRNPEKVAKQAIRSAIEATDNNHLINDEHKFEEATLTELMELLQDLPEWSEIESVLAAMDAEPDRNVEEDIIEF